MILSASYHHFSHNIFFFPTAVKGLLLVSEEGMFGFSIYDINQNNAK